MPKQIMFTGVMLVSIRLVLVAAFGQEPPSIATQPRPVGGSHSDGERAKNAETAQVEEYCQTFLDNEGYLLPEIGRLTALRQAVFQVEPNLAAGQNQQVDGQCWVLVTHEWAAFQQASGRLARQAAAARLRLAAERLIERTKGDSSYEATRRRLVADNYRQQSLERMPFSNEPKQPDQLRAEIEEVINGIINPASTHQAQEDLVTPIRQAIKETSEALAKAVHLEVRAAGTVASIYGREAFKPGQTVRHYEEAISSLSNAEKQSLVAHFDAARKVLEEAQLIPGRDEQVPDGNSAEYARLKQRLFLLKNAIDSATPVAASTTDEKSAVAHTTPNTAAAGSQANAVTSAAVNPPMDGQQQEAAAAQAAAMVDAEILKITGTDRATLEKSRAPDPFSKYFHIDAQDKEISDLFTALKTAGLTGEGGTHVEAATIHARGNSGYLKMFVTNSNSYAEIVNEVFKNLEAWPHWWTHRIVNLRRSMECAAGVKHGTFEKDAPEQLSSSNVDSLIDQVNQKLPAQFRGRTAAPSTEAQQ